MSHSDKQVFPPFKFDRWRAVDDRVRGGSSTSHLDPVHLHHSAEGTDLSTEKSAKGDAARFWGHLGKLSDSASYQ